MGFLICARTVVVVCQTADLQGFRRFEKGVQLVLGHVHLPVVHELEQREEIVVLDVAQDDYRVLAWVALQ